MPPMSNHDASILVHGLRDYCKTGVMLVWQRQVIFLAALTLAAFYYNALFAFCVLLLISMSEFYDYWTFRRILRSRDRRPTAIRRNLRLLQVGTAFSASVIATYSIGLAAIDGPTTHFMSMFFLFAAGLFATMHNHQLVSIIVIRLSIYFAAFLFIPIKDILATGSEIDSLLWSQLFTSIFVVFFIVESARNYYRLYNIQISQMEALREEHAKTQDALKAKTAFVSTMSHELRTPLTSIKGAVELLSAEKLGQMPEPAKNTLAIARRNCTRLLKLINEILDIQKLESGSLNVYCRELNLHEVLSESIADNEAYASSFDVRLEYAQPDRHTRVWADSSRLQQVFTNILSNAAKFSYPGGKVEISVEPSDSSVRVHFRDEGIGLSEGDSDKVFDQFTQLDSTDTRRHDGSGLGMNISRQILTALGGSIWYSKNVGDGTTFSVELPAVT